MKTKKCLSGFTLVEILIAMIIMAIGLLGLASLQAIALRDNQDAFYHRQAVLLAYEMQDRIMANKTGWIDSTQQTTINIDTTCPSSYTALCSSSFSACETQAMAQNDFEYWCSRVAEVLPSATVTIEKGVCPEKIENCTISPSLDDNASLCIKTEWKPMAEIKNCQLAYYGLTVRPN